MTTLITGFDRDARVGDIWHGFEVDVVVVKTYENYHCDVRELSKPDARSFYQYLRGLAGYTYLREATPEERARHGLPPSGPTETRHRSAPLDANGVLLRVGDQIDSTADYNREQTFRGEIVGLGWGNVIGFEHFPAGNIIQVRVGDGITTCASQLWERAEKDAAADDERVWAVRFRGPGSNWDWAISACHSSSDAPAHARSKKDAEWLAGYWRHGSLEVEVVRHPAHPEPTTPRPFAPGDRVRIRASHRWHAGRTATVVEGGTAQRPRVSDGTWCGYFDAEELERVEEARIPADAYPNREQLAASYVESLKAGTAAARPFKVGDRVRVTNCVPYPSQNGRTGTIEATKAEPDTVVDFMSWDCLVRCDGIGGSFYCFHELAHLDEPAALNISHSESPVHDVTGRVIGKVVDSAQQTFADCPGGPAEMSVPLVAPSFTTLTASRTYTLPAMSPLARFDADRPDIQLAVLKDRSPCPRCRKDVMPGDAYCSLVPDGAWMCVPCGEAEVKRLDKVREGLEAEERFAAERATK